MAYSLCESCVERGADKALVPTNNDEEISVFMLKIVRRK